MESIEAQDLFLTDAIRKGDPKVFEVIYRYYYAKLCFYAYSMVHDRDISKDVVHDVFSNMWTRRIDLQHVVSLKFYLYRAVKNKAINYLKLAKTKITSPVDSELIQFKSSENIESDYERNELEGIVEKIIDELPPKCREVFILVKYQGLKYHEAAEILQISPNTVDNHMAKAFSKLRKELTPYLK